MEGHAGVASALMEAHADVGRAERDGLRPLMHAADSGDAWDFQEASIL